MTLAAVLVVAMTVAGWAYIFVSPREGIWARSWLVAGLLVTASVVALWRAGELGDAVGTTSWVATIAGLGAGVVWVVATQVGHRFLCRFVPSFIEQVRDLYSIAAGDRRVDVAVALVAMAVAEEFVFRLVVQREFGIVVGVVAYAAVQAVERNWALVLAGAACGAVWGVLYAWQGNLAAPLVAHVVWTSTLTFFWPLSGCNGHRVPESAHLAVTDT